MICTIWKALSALGPFLVSLGVLYVAYQQYKTSSNKLRLDLYDRRLGVYLKAIDFYGALTKFDNSNPAHSSLHIDFVKAVRESRFLFGADSAATLLLEEMHDRAANIIGFRDSGHEVKSDHEEYLRWFNSQQSDLLWFGGKDGLLALERELDRYLDFHRIGAG